MMLRLDYTLVMKVDIYRQEKEDGKSGYIAKKKDILK